MRDEKKKEFKDEMGGFIELFRAFKDQQTWKKAQNYIEMLKREIINFPEFLREYIIKNFMPRYKKYIKFKISQRNNTKTHNFDKRIKFPFFSSKI